MPERPSPVNDSLSVQPLQGSVEQAAPPTTSSKRKKATGSSVSNDSTVTLEVFSYNVLVLHSNRGLSVISCCPTLYFLGYVFPVTREPVVVFFLDFEMGAHGR